MNEVLVPAEPLVRVKPQSRAPVGSYSDAEITLIGRKVVRDLYGLAVTEEEQLQCYQLYQRNPSAYRTVAIGIRTKFETAWKS